MKQNTFFSLSHQKTNLLRKLSIFVFTFTTLSACTSMPATRPDAGDGLLGCKTESFPKAMLVSMLENEQPSNSFDRVKVEREGKTYFGIKNLPLQQADLIRTDKGAQTLLLLKGCNVAMLDSETSIRLVNPTTIIDLIVGLLFMNDGFNTSHKAIVMNGDSIVAPDGTEYLAKAQGKRFSVAVYNGKVRLTSRGNPNTSFAIPASQQVVRANSTQYDQPQPANVKELERAKDLTDRLLQNAVSANRNTRKISNSTIKSLVGTAAAWGIFNEFFKDTETRMVDVDLSGFVGTAGLPSSASYPETVKSSNPDAALLGAALTGLLIHEYLQNAGAAADATEGR